MSTGENNFDRRAFRTALGRFPTGIAVVTTRGVDAAPVGITVNSFNSVSLDPPLVLWSLQRDSTSLDDFRQSGRYAVNILSSDQAALSQRFASQVANKFDGVDWAWNDTGMPLIGGAIASFDCRIEAFVDGGDHLILLGAVTAFAAHAGQPLIYCGGDYARLSPPDLSDR